LVTAWFPEDLRARLYSTILAIEQIGMLMGEPLQQNLFAWAMHLTKTWLGLPFLFSGVSTPYTSVDGILTLRQACYLFAFGSSLFMRVDFDI